MRFEETQRVEIIENEYDRVDFDCPTPLKGRRGTIVKVGTFSKPGEDPYNVYEVSLDEAYDGLYSWHFYVEELKVIENG